MSNLTAAECHESAHLVAGEILGELPNQITVFDSHNGHTLGLGRIDEDPRDRIVSLLAGRAAEIAFGFAIGPRDRSLDQRQAHRLALMVSGFPVPDVETSLRATAAILAECEKRASQLVAGHLREISSIAANLQANGGRLAGAEVAAALRAAFPDAQTNAAAGGAHDTDGPRIRAHRPRPSRPGCHLASGELARDRSHVARTRARPRRHSLGSRRRDRSDATMSERPPFEGRRRGRAARPGPDAALPFALRPGHHHTRSAASRSSSTGSGTDRESRPTDRARATTSREGWPASLPCRVRRPAGLSG